MLGMSAYAACTAPAPNIKRAKYLPRISLLTVSNIKPFQRSHVCCNVLTQMNDINRELICSAILLLGSPEAKQARRTPRLDPS